MEKRQVLSGTRRGETGSSIQEKIDESIFLATFSAFLTGILSILFYYTHRLDPNCDKVMVLTS